jgi:hypothetical protein
MRYSASILRTSGGLTGGRVILRSGSDYLYQFAEAIQMGAYEFPPRSVGCHQVGWVLQGALSTGMSAP